MEVSPLHTLTPEGGRMPTEFEERLLRVPMSWEDYLSLPEQPRAEWVDGVAVVMNVPPGFHHGTATIELGSAVRAALPGHYVATEAYLRLPDNRVRLPDIMVTDVVPENDWVDRPPLMVAEVLSRSTRSEDLVAKMAEYAEGGVGQYWIVDPEQRTLEALRLVDGAWQILVHLDDDHPEADVELAGVQIALDLRRLLRRSFQYADRTGV